MNRLHSPFIKREPPKDMHLTDINPASSPSASSTSLPSPAMSRHDQASSSYDPDESSYASAPYVVPGNYPTYMTPAVQASHIQGIPINIPPVGSSTASSGYYAAHPVPVVGAGGPVYVPTNAAGAYNDPLSLDYEALFPKSSSMRPKHRSNGSGSSASFHLGGQPGGSNGVPALGQGSVTQMVAHPITLPSYLDLPHNNFVRQSFPLEIEDHKQLKVALERVMTSLWKLEDAFEPDEQLLLQFMRYSNGRWYCRFWENGRPCGKSCKKKDHAKSHIRFHINHRPFICSKPCPRLDPNCDKRYSAAGPLQKHRNPKARCERCGLSMLQGNLQRHQLVSCRGQYIGGASPSDSEDSEDE
ncbi:hypothetical protein CPB86DRAFT_779985 [Serendipita vermifera]|nr:hypothetical protein CPB86DRAFT_779985 [Serendipita vermifera]